MILLTFVRLQEEGEKVKSFLSRTAPVKLWPILIDSAGKCVNGVVVESAMTIIS